MKTIDYLTGDLAGLYWPAVGTAAVVAVLGGVLSVLVVLKRLAFVGHGVSHAAFGGVGLAFALGIVGGTVAGDLGLLAIIVCFSVAAGLGVAAMSDRQRTGPDTAIGIVLAASMAAGFVLYSIGARRAAARGGTLPGIEQVLFGQVFAVGWTDFAVAVAVAAGVLMLLAHRRRAVLFWAFDEPACAAFGVRPDATKRLVLVLLAVSVVVTMKLAGIVLATALFVLPGATALALSDRLGRVVALAAAAGLAAVGAGVVLAFEADWAVGPGIVLASAALYAAARVFAWARRSGADPRAGRVGREASR